MSCGGASHRMCGKDINNLWASNNSNTDGTENAFSVEHGATPENAISSNVIDTVGESGKSITLLSNCFLLNVSNDETRIFQYLVTFDPDGLSPKARRSLLLKQSVMFGAAFVYDGGSDLKMLQQLHGPLTVTSIHKHNNLEIEITISIRPVGMLDWSDPQMLRFFDKQMRRYFGYLKYVPMLRIKYPCRLFHVFIDPSSEYEFPEHKLKVWNGMQTSFNTYDDDILIRCECTSQVLRSETVYEVLVSLFKSLRDRNHFRETVCMTLCGSVVMTTYNKKTYIIDDIAWDKNPQFVFQKNNRNVAITDYCLEKYNVEIRDLKQPLIVGRATGRDREQRFHDEIGVFLVPELCVPFGLDDSQRNDSDLSVKMAKITEPDPTSHVQRLQKFIRSLNSNNDVKKEMELWGLSFDENLMKVCGRQLEKELIVMQATHSYPQNCGDFGNLIREQKMKQPKAFNNWCVVTSERDRQLSNELIEVLNRLCPPMGITINRPNVVIARNDSAGGFVNACTTVPVDTEIVVVIIPNKSRDRIDSIKRLFYIRRPMQLQLIISESIGEEGLVSSIGPRIALQMSAKLGAEAWSLGNFPKDLMVSGFYHESVRNSVGGFVCSVNECFTQWHSRAKMNCYNPKEATDLSANLIDGLKVYGELNGRMPAHVYVYCNLVANHILQFPLLSELQQLKEELKKIDENLRLTFIFVKEDEGRRFFVKHGNEYRNPVLGTVVDATVPRSRFDFYLLTQCKDDETSSPTLYKIVEDESEWQPSQHHELAYKLCHLCYDHPGVIGIPAPLEYAKQLANLTASLPAEPSAALSNTLFYLQIQDITGVEWR